MPSNFHPEDNILLLFMVYDKITVKICDFPSYSLSKQQIKDLVKEVDFYNNHIRLLLEGKATPEFYRDPIDKEILYEIACGRGYDFVSDEQLYADKYYNIIANPFEFFLYKGHYEEEELTDITQEIAFGIFLDKLFENTLFSMGGLFPLEITLKGIQRKL